jgi:hypothetical protein
VWLQELPTKGMADSASKKTLTKLKLWNSTVHGTENRKEFMEAE